MRPGVTLDDVTRAADELLGRGERPTVEGVRTVLRTGSPATVNSLLKDYFRALQGRLNLPAPVAQAAADLVAKIRGTLDAAAAEQEAARAEAHAKAQTALAAERAGFETERQQLRDQVGILTVDLAAQRDRAARTETLLEARQTEMAALVDRASTSESRAQAAAEERERASQNHQREIVRLQERADGNERHLLTQIDELREQIKQARIDRDREQQQAAKRLSELEKIVGIATESAAAARQALVARDAELAHERHTLETAQAALQVTRERHEREIQYQQERQASVARERDEAAVRVSELAAERDRLTQAALALESRCASLQTQLTRQGASNVTLGS